MKHLSTTLSLVALAQLTLAQNVTVTETVTVPETTVTVTGSGVSVPGSTTTFSSIGNSSLGNSSVVRTTVTSTNSSMSATSTVVPIPPISWSTETVSEETTLLLTSTFCSGEVCPPTVSSMTTVVLTLTSCADESCITIAPVSSEIEYSLISLANTTTPVAMPTAIVAKESNMFNKTSSALIVTSAKSQSIEEMSENDANIMNAKNLVSIVGAAIVAIFL